MNEKGRKKMRAMYREGRRTCLKVELDVKLNMTGEPVYDWPGVTGNRDHRSVSHCIVRRRSRSIGHSNHSKETSLM